MHEAIGIEVIRLLPIPWHYNMIVSILCGNEVFKTINIMHLTKSHLIVMYPVLPVILILGAPTQHYKALFTFEISI